MSGQVLYWNLGDVKNKNTRAESAASSGGASANSSAGAGNASAGNSGKKEQDDKEKLFSAIKPTVRGIGPVFRPHCICRLWLGSK